MRNLPSVLYRLQAKPWLIISVPLSISLPRLRHNVAAPSAVCSAFVANRAARAGSEIKGNLAAIAFLSLLPRAQVY